MSIKQEEIGKFSKKLAKLAPTNEEKLLQSINSILKYVDLLNEINTDGVIPTISVISKEKNSFKDDIIKRNINPFELLACSKQKIIANQIAIDDIMK